MGEHAIEVLDKSAEFRCEIGHARKVAAAHYNAEHNFNLIQPRTPSCEKGFRNRRLQGKDRRSNKCRIVGY